MLFERDEQLFPSRLGQERRACRANLLLSMQHPLARLFLVGFLLIARAGPSAQGDPTDSPWVTWDRTTDRVVSAANDTGAACPRARQLSNGEILLAYHHGEALGNCGSRVTLRKSRDGGASWYQTREIEGPNEKGFWGFCNPDFIELGHGRLMLVSAARGKADPKSRNGFLSEGRHSGLRVRFSDDFGATWGPPRMVAGGRGRVWEPSIARLPGGELEIFYANESPTLQEEGATQCIECIRSTDAGQTWTTPVLVTEKTNCRTGMPAALALSNGHVALGQEVVGLATSPWIADTFHGHAQDEHLAQDQYEFGGAPFLTRAPDGSTLLAFHSQCRQTAYLKSLPGSWLLSDIFVQRGDAAANHFGPASCPWPTVNELSGAFFPSLLAMRDGTLVAMASFITVHPNHTTSTIVRWIKGRLTDSAAKPRPRGSASVRRSSSHGRSVDSTDARLASAPTLPDG